MLLLGGPFLTFWLQELVVSGPPELLVEVLDHLLQCGGDAGFFVVGWDHALPTFSFWMAAVLCFSLGRKSWRRVVRSGKERETQCWNAWHSYKYHFCA